MSCSGTATATVVLNDQRTVGANSSQSTLAASLQPAVAFTSGTGANQGNEIFNLSRTFSGTTDILTLSSGLTDQYGGAITLARVKAMAIVNTGNAPIAIGANGTDPWTGLLNSTGTITLPPGAFFIFATPDATGAVVTSGTADRLLVTGTSGQTYQLVGLGANA